MDVDAGMPILGASIAAMLLFVWLQLERVAIRRNLAAYGAGPEVPRLIGRLERTYIRVRWIALWSAVAAPTVMFFSGQLDAHGIAHVFDNRLQFIAPLTSAYFAAAVAWLLIAAPLAVHGSYCELLKLFGCTRLRKEFW